MIKPIFRYSCPDIEDFDFVLLSEGMTLEYFLKLAQTLPLDSEFHIKIDPNGEVGEMFFGKLKENFVEKQKSAVREYEKECEKYRQYLRKNETF